MWARLITEITVDEYLEAEDGAEVRHEYVYGEVFALAGGSVSHNVIGANVVHLFVRAAGSGCRAYGSDMKLRVEEKLFYYPDAMVVCEAPANDYFETSPCVVVEVVSPSTARNDRLEKRFAYLSLPSVVAVGGSWLAPPAEVAAGAWDAITSRAKRSMALAQPSP